MHWRHHRQCMSRHDIDHRFGTQESSPLIEIDVNVFCFGLYPDAKIGGVVYIHVPEDIVLMKIVFISVQMHYKLRLQCKFHNSYLYERHCTVQIRFLHVFKCSKYGPTPLITVTLIA